jgi:hypothetical protein
MYTQKYIKYKQKYLAMKQLAGASQSSVNNHYNILLLCTAENRILKTDDIPYDLPPLENDDGTISDPLNERSNFEMNKQYVLNTVRQILVNKEKDIKYHSIDPAYLDVKRQPIDDINYIKHIPLLLSEIDTTSVPLFDLIYVIGCYTHLFDITNVDIMYAIIKPSGYILIYGSVPYLYTDYFTSKFEKLNDTTYVKI